MKWMLEDPRVNFATSQRGRETGIRHLGDAEKGAAFRKALAELEMRIKLFLSGACR
jgi:hypothetical protein